MAKNVIEGLASLCEHINATHFKFQVVKTSLVGEFEIDELQKLHGLVDRTRWRLLVLQNIIAEAVAVQAAEGQLDLLGSAVPEPSSAVPRDHRSNGSCD